MEHEWQQAVRRSDLEALRRLLTGEQNINARDQHGQTALMIAAQDGKSEVVTFLVEHGALLNHTAKYGLSALMLAVIRGHVGVVKILANAGADMTIRGSGAPGFADKTAFDLAVAQDRPDIALSTAHLEASTLRASTT
jgi:ankyrin repeat protein